MPGIPCSLNTVCPISSDPFYIVSYSIKWVTTSWTHSIKLKTGLRISSRVHVIWSEPDPVFKIRSAPYPVFKLWSDPVFKLWPDSNPVFKLWPDSDPVSKHGRVRIRPENQDLKSLGNRIFLQFLLTKMHIYFKYFDSDVERKVKSKR